MKINCIELFKILKVKKITAGSISSLALTEGGQVYVWGSQQNGQLGIGPKNYPSPIVPVPTIVSLLGTEKIADISSGDSHAVALSETGQHFGWGKGFSLDSQIEVVSFYPKRLSEIERDHIMMLESLPQTTLERPVTERSNHSLLDQVRIEIPKRQKDHPRPLTQMLGSNQKLAGKPKEPQTQLKLASPRRLNTQSVITQSMKQSTVKQSTVKRRQK